MNELFDQGLKGMYHFGALIRTGLIDWVWVWIAMLMIVLQVTTEQRVNYALDSSSFCHLLDGNELW